MARRIACILACLPIALLSFRAASAQADRSADIGYVFPAGGQRGTTVHVVVGGQMLQSATAAVVSGEGVHTANLSRMRPPTRYEVGESRRILDLARERFAEERGNLLGPKTYRQVLDKLADDNGYTAEQLVWFQTYVRRQSDSKRQPNPQLADYMGVDVAIDSNAEPGIREIRLRTPDGLSNPVRFLIGRLPEMQEEEACREAAEPVDVASLPVVINGQIMPGDVDRYRFRARRGQRILADVAARALTPYLADAVPGWFQAVVALYDDAGQEVAYADDFRFDPDPVLACEIPRDGNYVLAIRDSIWRGREDFVYRIALGELPFVSGVFPLGAPTGKPVTLNVEGWNLSPAQRVLQLAACPPGPTQLVVRGEEWTPRPLPFEFGDLPERTESEPAGGGPHVEPVELPVIVNGRIDRPGDWDSFRFHAEAGQRIVAEVHARRLASPLDSLLKLTGPDGNVLAINDDHEDAGEGLITHHADSYLSVEIPAAGEYVLHLGDTQHKGGPAYAYRLRIAPPRSGFQLRIEPSALNVPAGQTVPVTVHALRSDDFGGDIDLALLDAPEGFRLSGWLPAGHDKAVVTLTVPYEANRVPRALRMVGSAGVDGRRVTHAAVPADDAMQAFAYHHLVPAESWTVAVSPAGWLAAGWRCTAPTPLTIPRGGTLALRLYALQGTGLAQMQAELVKPPPCLKLSELRDQHFDRYEAVIAADPNSPTAGAGSRGNLLIRLFDMDGERRNDRGLLPALPFIIVDSPQP